DRRGSPPALRRGPLSAARHDLTRPPDRLRALRVVPSRWPRDPGGPARGVHDPDPVDPGSREPHPPRGAPPGARRRPPAEAGQLARRAGSRAAPRPVLELPRRAEPGALPPLSREPRAGARPRQRALAAPGPPRRPG